MTDHPIPSAPADFSAPNCTRRRQGSRQIAHKGSLKTSEGRERGGLKSSTHRGHVDASKSTTAAVPKTASTNLTTVVFDFSPWFSYQYHYTYQAHMYVSFETTRLASSDGPGVRDAWHELHVGVATQPDVVDCGPGCGRLVGVWYR